MEVELGIPIRRNIIKLTSNWQQTSKSSELVVDVIYQSKTLLSLSLTSSRINDSQKGGYRRHTQHRQDHDMAKSPVSSVTSLSRTILAHLRRTIRIRTAVPFHPIQFKSSQTFPYPPFSKKVHMRFTIPSKPTSHFASSSSSFSTDSPCAMLR